MRKHSFPLYFTVLCCAVFTNACRNSKVAGTKEVPEFTVHASAQPYISALGKGRGVLFHVYFNSPDSLNLQAFKLDSLIVNNKSIPASWSPEVHKPVIEGNYFIAEKEPGHGEIPKPGIDAPDPVLYLSQYLPATLYFHYEEKPYVIPIPHFEPLSD